MCAWACVCFVYVHMCMGVYMLTPGKRLEWTSDVLLHHSPSYSVESASPTRIIWQSLSPRRGVDTDTKAAYQAFLAFWGLPVVLHTCIASTINDRAINPALVCFWRQGLLQSKLILNSWSSCSTCHTMWLATGLCLPETGSYCITRAGRNSLWASRWPQPHDNPFALASQMLEL